MEFVDVGTCACMLYREIAVWNENKTYHGVISLLVLRITSKLLVLAITQHVSCAKHCMRLRLSAFVGK